MVYKHFGKLKLGSTFSLPLLFLLLFASFSNGGGLGVDFKYEHSAFLKHIPEPSDIAYDSATKHYFIVSDHGKLFECELSGKIIRKAKFEGLDFEGVEVKDGFVYVSDESGRMVYKYKQRDLSLVKSYPVKWEGAINKAYESIAYNYAKKCFVLVAEKPATIVEFDENFNELKRYPFRYAKNISGARWHNNALFLLSSAGNCIIKCDPETYLPTTKYNINVVNAEGMTFDSSGNVTITSDDFQHIYYFKNLPNSN